MRRRIQRNVLQWANIIEILMAILLSVLIGILSVFLIVRFKDLLVSGQALSNFNEFLAMVLNLVVGVEFIKMLCRHTPETVIEVLLFAIARQLIVSHGSTFENLIGILSIAILFAIRKYLFCHEKGDKIIED